MPNENRIGLYGGTFDPVHHGHLILARAAAEKFQLDQVIFVPALISPHKIGMSATSADARLAMLRAATAGEPRFMINDLELSRPPPSFTIDSVETIAASNPGATLFLLIGDDQLPRLGTWHRFEELSRRAEIIVLARLADTRDYPYRSVDERIDISATDIRNRVATGESIRYLVPEAVARIIADRQLYRTTSTSPKNN